MNAPTRIADKNSYKFGNLVADKLPRLQAQTLLFCASGFSEKKSAAALNCSVSTVRDAKKTLFYKLSANSATELVTKAFASAYLRFASLLMAIIVSFAAPIVNDHNTIARLGGRHRPTNNMRARGNAKNKTGTGIYWSPETNELVWS